MVANNDFDVQFNASAKYRRGSSLPPYRYNVTSRPRCVGACVTTKQKHTPTGCAAQLMTYMVG
jgi:hypothetical protein